MKTKNNKIIFKSISSEEEAKNLYCHGEYIYVTNDKRTMCKIPPSYYYGSHASEESLFYRGLPKYEGENKFYTEWTPEWKVVHESDDENGNPTTWAMDIIGTEYEEDLGSMFIWIALTPNKTYNIETYNTYTEEWTTKATCKTLASAKRWVTMYIL